jgi:hypothetical protein
MHLLGHLRNLFGVDFYLNMKDLYLIAQNHSLLRE